MHDFVKTAKDTFNIKTRDDLNRKTDDSFVTTETIEYFTEEEKSPVKEFMDFIDSKTKAELILYTSVGIATALILYRKKMLGKAVDISLLVAPFVVEYIKNKKK